MLIPPAIDLCLLHVLYVLFQPSFDKVVSIMLIYLIFYHAHLFFVFLLVSVSAGMEVRAVSTLFDHFNSTEDSRWCVRYIHETVVDHVTCIFLFSYVVIIYIGPKC